MIISHKHKFIYVAIPKTGTHSLRNELRPHLGAYDWEQCNLFENKTFPHKQISRIVHGHLTINHAQNILRGEIWNEYFKFCFFRDPIERFLSFVYFINRDNESSDANVEEKVEQYLSNPNLASSHLLLYPQSQFIKDQDGEIAVDFIGRLEYLHEDLEILAESINLPLKMIQRINSSKSKKLKLSTEQLISLQEIYKEDYDVIAELDLKNKPYLVE